MKKHFLILLTTFLFLSCSEQKKEKVTVDKEIVKTESIVEQNDSIKASKYESQSSKKIVERYFPDKKETVKFDTLISSRNLKVSIQSRYLNSYVTSKFESEGIKYIDKYRDSEKHLIIKNSNEILIDTVFKKKDFVNLAGQDFLNIANFHGYWFNENENDIIELFGVISKPETDWSISFYHYFDLKTRTFKIEENSDDEI